MREFIRTVLTHTFFFFFFIAMAFVSIFSPALVFKALRNVVLNVMKAEAKGENTK